MYCPKNIKILLILAVLSIPFTATASQCPASNVVTNPTIFVWKHHPVTADNLQEYYSGTLEMGEASFDINGETLNTRAYRQQDGAYSIPGPTFVMNPGSKYVLSFKNLLPYAAPESAHNVFKDPNITNVHTHGLHISGESPSDDVTRFFEGGFGGDYVWDIPADHMGGTFWYHAHKHGSTFLQVSSGAFGMMIIDDGQDVIPANVAAMQERHFVMGFVDSDVAGTGGDTIVGGNFTPKWTINGTVAGNVCMQPNTWQHWRVLVADRDARLKTLTVGSECEAVLLARDGVWRTEVPKTLATNSITLTGASRADIAVRCVADSIINLGSETMAQVFVDGTADSSAHPYDTDGTSTWFSQRPSYLRDLRSEPLAGTATIRMGARTINGSKFDKDVPNISLNADGVYEWSLRGATNHPFHLHIYHVQVNGSCGEFEDGEFYDVIASSCDIRFDLNPATTSVYDGRTIMHCHILAHEDQGAMGWLDVLGGKGPPTFPINNSLGFNYSDYYSFGGGVPTTPTPPSSLAATSSSNSQIDLSWTDNANDETSFNIERSPDGINFNPLNTLIADQTSYSDTGLSGATTYSYRINAYNGAGVSAFSNIASATTTPDVGGASLAVRSITLGTIRAGKGFKHGSATIVIEDNLGNLVQGAAVAGVFTGTFNEVVASSDPSDSSGSTSINTTDQAKGTIVLTFCVTGITAANLTDFSAEPGQICGSL